MGKGSECLRPDNTKVSQTLVADLSEDAVEDIGQGSQTEGQDHCLSTSIAVEYFSLDLSETLLAKTY